MGELLFGDAFVHWTGLAQSSVTYPYPSEPKEKKYSLEKRVISRRLYGAALFMNMERKTAKDSMKDGVHNGNNTN